jgi:periplasmic divalent cation tolerance protein
MQTYPAVSADSSRRSFAKIRPRMETECLVVFSTCPDAASAEKIARGLVERGLAACVNILPGLRSVYTWKGACESTEELLLLVKIQGAAYDAVEQALRALHPYELPEIVAVPIAAGLPDYLAWIKQHSAPI